MQKNLRFCLRTLCSVDNVPLPFNVLSVRRVTGRNEISASLESLSRLLKSERFHEALQTAIHMDNEGLLISRDIVYCLLQGCTKMKELAAARQVHSLMLRTGLHSVVCLGDHLIRLYALCGSLLEAYQVFCHISKPTVFTWNAILSAHANLGEGRMGIELYARMQQDGIKSDKVTFLCILKACSSTGALGHGRLIHEQITRSGLELDVVIGNTLVDMYVKCEKMEEACKVFHWLPDRNVVSWDAMISGYCQHGHVFLALELYEEMQQEGIQPDHVTFLCVLRACGSIDAICLGGLIHEKVIKSRLECDVIIGSSLVDMYSKCGRVDEARRVFDQISTPNLVSWGSMIAGYAEHGHGFPALELLENMKQKGITPDKYIYSSILKACGSVGAIGQGRLIHEEIARCGLESGAVVGNTLVDMYVKCGSLMEGRRAFDKLPCRDLVSWGSMIAGYVQNGCGHLALALFKEMLQEGIKPKKITYMCILKACASIRDMEIGRVIHDQVINSSFEQDVLIGSSLVDMYAKCGYPEEAWQVFNSLQNRNLVSWSAMITGYAQLGLGLPALELFEKMQQQHIKPNRVIFLCALRACGCIGALSLGVMIHSQIVRSGLETDLAVGSAIVDMYSKCGSLEKAENAFDKLPCQDVALWSAIIAGHSRCGNYGMAVHCLKCMGLQGFKPDDTIFTSILAVCSHAGLVEEGHLYFKSMREDHGMAPSIEHFVCLADMLGRAGCLKEAEALLQTMPVAPDIIAWRSLLTSCRTYGDMKLGRRCFDQAVQVNPDDASVYVLMSSVYADANMWEDVNSIEDQRNCLGAWKKPGRAWIDLKDRIYEFIVGDESFSQNCKTYLKVKQLNRSMKNGGFIPQLDSVLESSSEENKEEAICGDGLKLAFGHLSTPKGTPVDSVKNGLVFTDFSNASKLERSEIMVRNENHFHNLKEGRLLLLMDT